MARDEVGAGRFVQTMISDVSPAFTAPAVGALAALFTLLMLVAGSGVLAAEPLPGGREVARVGATPAAVTAPGHARVSTCLSAAAAHHRVDAALLHAIAVVESDLNPQAVGPRNRNGTHDIGLMQVNSSWLPRLAPFGIDAPRLRDPCVSAYVGAWILADNIRRHGPVWRAVGAYNARTPARQAIYVQKVQRALARGNAFSAAGPAPGSTAPGR